MYLKTFWGLHINFDLFFISILHKWVMTQDWLFSFSHSQFHQNWNQPRLEGSCWYFDMQSRNQKLGKKNGLGLDSHMKLWYTQNDGEYELSRHSLIKFLTVTNGNDHPVKSVVEYSCDLLPTCHNFCLMSVSVSN